MNPAEEFRKECVDDIQKQGANDELRAMAKNWIGHPALKRYSYHFSWLGRPIIQYPQDIVAMQELIWRCRPDLIIETGIAHGGSLIFHASMLELNALCGGPAHFLSLGVDIDIRAHNRMAIQNHPIFKRGHIKMIEGSSVAPDVISQVREIARDYDHVMVVLDSNHTHAHVLAELTAYAPLVTKGSYCVVFDTIIEDMPENSFPDRPWGKGNNAATATREFLATYPNFKAEKEIEDKLLLTVAPGGFLKRIS